MEAKLFCQSCSMPLETDALKGTEKDGTKSNQYCKYCYDKGAFIDPDMTLDEMKVVVETEMKKRNIPDNIIQMSLTGLPGLKRWT